MLHKRITLFSWLMLVLAVFVFGADYVYASLFGEVGGSVTNKNGVLHIQSSGTSFINGARGLALDINSWSDTPLKGMLLSLGGTEGAITEEQIKSIAVAIINAAFKKGAMLNLNGEIDLSNASITGDDLTAALKDYLKTNSTKYDSAGVDALFKQYNNTDPQALVDQSYQIIDIIKAHKTTATVGVAQTKQLSTERGGVTVGKTTGTTVLPVQLGGGEKEVRALGGQTVAPASPAATANEKGTVVIGSAARQTAVAPAATAQAAAGPLQAIANSLAAAWQWITAPITALMPKAPTATPVGSGTGKTPLALGKPKPETANLSNPKPGVVVGRAGATIGEINTNAIQTQEIATEVVDNPSAVSYANGTAVIGGGQTPKPVGNTGKPDTYVIGGGQPSGAIYTPSTNYHPTYTPSNTKDNVAQLGSGEKDPYVIQSSPTQIPASQGSFSVGNNEANQAAIVVTDDGIRSNPQPTYSPPGYNPETGVANLGGDNQYSYTPPNVDTNGVAQLGGENPSFVPASTGSFRAGEAVNQAAVPEVISSTNQTSQPNIFVKWWNQFLRWLPFGQ